MAAPIIAAAPMKEGGLGPVGRVDTRDFWQDMAQQTTRKMAAWFEMNGRTRPGRRKRIEDREWIQAIKYGVSQNDRIPDFDTLYKGSFALSPDGNTAAGSSASPDMPEARKEERRCQQRAAALQRTEESLWVARHRGFARSVGPSVGRPQPRTAEAGHQISGRAGNSVWHDDEEFTSGSAMRARTLWLPVAEVARNNIPERTLVAGGPRMRGPVVQRHGAAHEEDRHVASSLRGQSRPGGADRRRDAAANTAGRALGLWQSLNAAQ
uniref:Uncharacterized protein n=1 Tax=Pyrodinium bahamense TaxID=73915 RepID=A0A7R9ZWY1_9DINO